MSVVSILSISVFRLVVSILKGYNVVSTPVQMNTDLSATARALFFSCALSTKPNPPPMWKRLFPLNQLHMGQGKSVTARRLGLSASAHLLYRHQLAFFLQLSRWALVMHPFVTVSASAAALAPVAAAPPATVVDFLQSDLTD